MNVELVLWKDQKRECVHCGFLETMIFAGARLILTQLNDLQNFAKREEYFRIKVSHFRTYSTTEMKVITLEKDVEPQVAFGLIYLQLLFLIQSRMILLCFVYILPFLLGTSFPTPSTWKASSAHLSSCSVSSMSSSLSFPKQTWMFLIHQVLMYVFMKSGISLYYVYNVYTNMGPQIWGFPVGSAVKNSPAMQEPQETWVQSLSQEDPLEKGMAIHSSILAWRIPWKEEPSRLQSIGSQRVGHD